MNAAAVRQPGPNRLPWEILGSVPRDVRLTTAGIWVVAAAAFVAVAGIVVTVVLSATYARDQRDRELRAREAVWVDAVVEQVRTINGENPRRAVNYRYQADGRSYAGRVSLRERDRRPAERGGTIRVAYISSRPDVNWAQGYEPRGVPFPVIPLAVLGLLPLAALIAWSVRRQWILLSEGRAAQARVTGHKKVHSDKHHSFRVSYEFQTISGAKQTSHYDVGRNPPPIGSVVSIVYHRESPKWTAPYPLKLVRPGYRE